MPTASVEDIKAKIVEYMQAAGGSLGLPYLKGLVRGYFHETDRLVTDTAWYEAQNAVLIPDPYENHLVRLKDESAQV